MRYLLTVCLLAAAVPAQQIPLPAFDNTYSAPQSRGYWFQAPVDFVIVGVRVPDETGAGVQAVEIVDFGAAPPTFPLTTTANQLFRATSQPSATPVTTSIPVHAGQFVGVLGGCGTTVQASSQAAAGTFASHVFGYPLTLTRLGTAANIHNFAGNPPCWAEAAGPIARVELTVAPAPGYAYATPFGTGCYDLSRSCYEVFPIPSTFDLDGLALQALPTGSGYVFLGGGAFVPPTPNATVLTLGDDAEVQVALTTPFPYDGTSTSSLEVCSNGFVSVATGNGHDYHPDPADWLQSPVQRWGLVHDLNPTIAGSGQVTFEEIGGITFVTWNDVYDFGVTGATGGNTFQLQFDCNTGAVTQCWVHVTGLGNGLLVGFAAGGPSRDLGSRDLSASLANAWTTDVVDRWSPVHGADARPRLGTTVNLTTGSIDAACPIGLTVLGMTEFPLGVALDVIGMPQCRAYASPDVLLAFLPVAGSASLPLPIPAVPMLAGVTVASQVVTLVPGVNQFGAMASNGLRLRIEAN